MGESYSRDVSSVYNFSGVNYEDTFLRAAYLFFPPDPSTSLERHFANRSDDVQMVEDASHKRECRLSGRDYPTRERHDSQNKNFSRNGRINDPAGTRDPNADTLDGRSAQIEKNVQEARSPQTKQVDGFAYRVKIRNSAAQLVEILFWEYQFIDPANESNPTRHQFLCGLSLGQGKEKELEGFSVSSPSSVVNVESLANKESSFRQKVVINRVEYADGAIWQRKDWSLKEVKASYERALNEKWQPGMCKGL